MNRSKEETDQFDAAANAIVNLSLDAEYCVQAGEWENAGARYGLIVQLAYGMVESMSKAASNDLKTKYLPEKLLEGLPEPEPTNNSYL